MTNLILAAAAIFLGAAATCNGAPPPATQPANELILDLGNKVTMRFALIPAGKFLMGSPDDETRRNKAEGPRHEVTISKPFYVGIYEVTQEQYGRVVGMSGIDPAMFKVPNLPMQGVSWNDAVEFCKKLSHRTGKAVSLPTEAQWEYACRAGTQTPFSCGDAELRDYAWFVGTTGGLGTPSTHPVGQKKPNAWGLYDMMGNVAELCADWSGAYAANSVTDPAGSADSKRFAIRGGSWRDDPAACRAASRFWYGEPNRGSKAIGFRVVVEPPAIVPGVGGALPTKTPDPSAREIVIEVAKGITMRFVQLPAGNFTMGSPLKEPGRTPNEEPHKVAIPEAIHMGVTEVTQEQYEAIMQKNPSKNRAPQNPVEQVTWEQAAAFCEKLTKQIGYPVRLPSEVEWEYACRAGTDTRFSFGDGEALLGDYGWFVLDAKRNTHPVAEKKANAWGLYDMQGNVREWCRDWFGKYDIEDAEDPWGPQSGTTRVVRGGSFASAAAGCRCAGRAGIQSTAQPDVGFRVVLDLRGPISIQIANESGELLRIHFEKGDAVPSFRGKTDKKMADEVNKKLSDPKDTLTLENKSARIIDLPRDRYIYYYIVGSAKTPAFGANWAMEIGSARIVKPETWNFAVRTNFGVQQVIVTKKNN